MNKLSAAVAVVAIFALAGCSSSTPSAKASPSGPIADAGAQLACGHFTDVMADFSKGLLTPTEMRAKLQEVYDSASVSQNAGIPDGATAMLRDSTADDGTTFLTDSVSFSAACNALGG